MHGAYCLLESLEQPDNFLEQVCMLESFHSVFIAKLISKDDVATSKTGRAWDFECSASISHTFQYSLHWFNGAVDYSFFEIISLTLCIPLVHRFICRQKVVLPDPAVPEEN